MQGNGREFFFPPLQTSLPILCTFPSSEWICIQCTRECAVLLELMMCFIESAFELASYVSTSPVCVPI